RSQRMCSRMARENMTTALPLDAVESHGSRNLFSSAEVTMDPRYPNVPFCFASVAALISPAIAARYSDEAKLIRLTPAAASSATLKDFPTTPTIQFTGLETAEQTF